MAESGGELMSWTFDPRRSMHRVMWAYKQPRYLQGAGAKAGAHPFAIRAGGVYSRAEGYPLGVQT
jgi:hypothetical protein